MKKIYFFLSCILAVLSVNAQNVGIGLTNPSAPLHIQSNNGGPGIRVHSSFPSLYLYQGSVADGFELSGYLGGSTEGLRLAASPLGGKNIEFFTSGLSRARFETDGTFRIRTEISLADENYVEKGFLQLSGDNLRIGTYSSNTLGKFIARVGGGDRFSVTGDGRIGINTISPEADLHIVSLSNGADGLRLEATFPTVEFFTAGTQKGFIQMTGQNMDIRALGGGQVRLGNELYVDETDNRVGIGTTTPEQKLHVTGVAKINSGRILNGTDDNMLPVGFATFNSDGTKRSGSANVTGGWIGDDFFLEIPGVNLNFATIVITCRNSSYRPTWSASSNDRIQINFIDNAGDKQRPTGFSVVVYKEN